jgi:hypothetical protein
MARVTVTIQPDGRVRIHGEGFETAALKKKLEEMGAVVERHEGHVHVKDSVETTEKVEEGR